jgi:hypothetical protein
MLEINKKASYPGREMFIKEVAISADRTGDTAADKARHDFAKDRGMIFRLRALCRFFDAEMPKGFA